METSFWAPYIPDSMVNAICWTLIHSLWIGLVIALLCGIVIAATRKSAAALRYRLLCGLLVLFVCAIGLTYYLEASPAPVYNVIGHAQNILVKAPVNAAVNPLTVPQNQTFLDSVQAFLNQNANIIVLIWLLFFVLKSLKMVSGLLYIQRIRNYKTSAVTEELKHRIEYLSSQIGIRRAVRLVQSELVKVPVAVGWLKPMILLPVGIAFQLSPEQLDGILWHELAHIYRRDYLVNILQGLVETVFFFNPGLLWLSSLIRAEREACCDDMVLSRMNRKANYLEALLSFGYGEFNQARYAMSIGSGNQLRDRLKRMISQENKRLSVAEKSVLTIGLVLLSAFTTISKDNPVLKHLTVKYKSKSEKMFTKTMDVSMHLLPENQRVKDSKPGARTKDTITVTDTVLRFSSVLFKNSDADLANNDISAKDDKGNLYHFVVIDGKIASMELNGANIEQRKLADYEYALQLIISEVMEKRRVRREDNAKFKANSPAAKFKGKDSIGWVKSGYIDKNAPGGISPKFNAMKAGFRDDSVGYEVQLQTMRNIIDNLVRDKVVAGAADVKWFGLSDTEFIVNGKKLSNEMQQRYKTKYGVHEGYGLYYGPVQMTGRGVFIDAKADAANFHMQNFRRNKEGQYGIDAQQFSDNQHKFQVLRDEQVAFDKYRDKTQEQILRQMETDRQKWHDGREQAQKQYEKYGAKYVDTANRYRDTNAWKLKQLIKQQQAFTAKISKDREELIKQQSRFAAEQDKKREQLIRQQQDFVGEQGAKRGQIMRQQQAMQARRGEKIQQYKQQHSFIDLQPAISAVIADLVNSNVISDKSDLIKFNLTNSTLIVNGKEQPKELHDRLKAKYLDEPKYVNMLKMANDPNFGLHFNAQNGSQGLGVTSGPDSP